MNKTAQKIKPLPIILAILIPLAVGGLSAALTADMMKEYHFMNKPPLSPPGWLFPVVWTILYVMMGLASYYVYASEADRIDKMRALTFYAAQLVLNFFWSLLFFRYDLYLLSFIWLAAMWVLIIITMALFMKISRAAGLMLLPLTLWTTFAAYLNCSVYILSKTPMPLPR